MHPKLQTLVASAVLLIGGCQGGDRPTEPSDVQSPADATDTPMAETDATKTIAPADEVDEDIERGMQADHFERETEEVLPIEKATEVPAGPVIDANKPNE